VRPLLWLVVFAAGFQNVFGVAIAPPYETYIEYKVYIVPGLLGMIALFNGMQSSLAMVYDREMGLMRLLLTAPLPRAWILTCKLAAGAMLSFLQMLAFIAAAWAFGIELAPMYVLLALPVFLLCALMLAALGLMLSVYIQQLENFAGTMNFVIFPMFFISSALYPSMETRRIRRARDSHAGDVQPLHARGRGHAFRAVWPGASGQPDRDGRLCLAVLRHRVVGLRPAARNGAPAKAVAFLSAGWRDSAPGSRCRPRSVSAPRWSCCRHRWSACAP
jgi:hypothetical protein